MIRGAQSRIYGSGAVGGVINIVTRRQGPLTFRARGETGSLEPVKAALGFRGKRQMLGQQSLKRTTGGFNIAQGRENDSGELSAAFKGGFKIFND